jgi:phosphoribosylanthranilate isomerase
VRVKVCGITRYDDALCAVDAGADTLGFIFVRESKRFIAPDAAGAIIAALPRDVVAVGVFVNPPHTEVREAVRLSGIGAVQLHGEEPPADAIGHAVRVIKAHRVRPGFDAALLAQYDVDAHLLDAFVDGMHGGTGQVFDWSIAKDASQHARVILSGGLRPENVAGAIDQVRPMAVDVSSGVERAAGIKDHARVRQFVRNAREAFAACAMKR